MLCLVSPRLHPRARPLPILRRAPSTEEYLVTALSRITYIRSRALSPARMSATTSRPLDAPALSPQWCSRRAAQLDASSLARCYLVCRAAVRVKGNDGKTFATRGEIIKEIIHEVRRHWRRNQTEMQMEMDARSSRRRHRRDSTD